MPLRADGHLATDDNSQRHHCRNRDEIRWTLQPLGDVADPRRQGVGEQVVLKGGNGWVVGQGGRRLNRFTRCAERRRWVRRQCRVRGVLPEQVGGGVFGRQGARSCRKVAAVLHVGVDHERCQRLLCWQWR